MTTPTLRRWLAPSSAVAVALTLGAAPAGRAADAPKDGVSPSAWDRQAAERYLDDREVWWQAWDRAKKDRGTFCVSCHTQASYGMARPVLREDLGEAGPGPSEQAMLASVEKRVHLWSQMQPFYSDIPSGAGKEVESHNSEAVLNAVILSRQDAHTGRLGDTARLAFDNAWALQSKTGPDAGSWVWQNFHYGPWEGDESQYHWAALMAVTVGKAPDHYRDDPKIAANLTALTGYLRGHYAAQPLLNKLVALWASGAFPEAIDPAERAKLIDTLYSLQHPDGGWSLSELDPRERADKTPQETRSDGYATAVTVLVLEEIAGPHGAGPHVDRGVDWLLANQDHATGAWTAWSINKNRDPKSDPGPFMTDAATAYAVLALEGRR